MNRDLDRNARCRSRRIRSRSAPAFAAVLSLLLLVTAIPALGASGTAAATAQRLAGGLRGGAARLNQLREPASTAQAQVSVALGQLREMNAPTADPHYLPALVAAGRAFVALSGQDPLTGTMIVPSYLGLERELAGSATGLERAADEADELSLGVRRLSRELSRSKKRARLLERQVQRLRAGDARPRQGD